jgi:hypothetical protein
MSKAVFQPFQEYQKARVTFVQTVAELAKRQQNIEALKNLGVMNLLGPLLSDPVPSVKQSAALAIGRLVKEDMELANIVVNEDKGKILLHLLESKDSNNKFYKQAACYVISSISKHNKELATRVKEVGSISFLVSCLEDYDPSLKQYAAWALMNIAEKSHELASEIEKSKGITCLIQCLQEPEIELKRVVVKTLSNIAKHSPKLAACVANTGDNLNNIIYYLLLKDTSLRRQILLCLSSIAKNIEDRKRILDSLDSNILIDCIQSKDITLQKNALCLINEIVKSSSNLATTIMSKIKPPVFVNYIMENIGEQRLFAINVISNLSSSHEENANNIITSDGHIALAQTLFTETDFKVLSAAAEAFYQLCRYKPDITNKIFKSDDHVHQNEKQFNIPYKLLELAVFRKEKNEISGKEEEKKRVMDAFNELNEKARDALEKLIETCSEMSVLTPLLDEPVHIPFDSNIYGEILRRVVDKMRNLLVNNKPLQTDFFRNKSLKKILDLQKSYPKLKDEILAYDFYDQNVINYFSDTYEKELLRKNDLL